MLKKAGIVVLGAAAGMGFLAPLANAGEAPTTADRDASTSHGHSDHGKGHGKGHGKAQSKGDGGASARNGDCANFGDQLVGANCTNVQAPINQLGVLSEYDNRGGGDEGASARNGDSANFGDQLIGLNGTNAQLPINQLGVLSKYDNRG